MIKLIRYLNWLIPTNQMRFHMRRLTDSEAWHRQLRSTMIGPVTSTEAWLWMSILTWWISGLLKLRVKMRLYIKPISSNMIKICQKHSHTMNLKMLYPKQWSSSKMAKVPSLWLCLLNELIRSTNRMRRVCLLTQSVLPQHQVELLQQQFWFLFSASLWF